MNKSNSIRKGKGVVETREVRFTLKDKYVKSKDTAPTKRKLTKHPVLIRAIFRYKQGKFVYSTKQKIEPNQWNDSKQLPKITYPFYDILKRDLDNISKVIRTIHRSNSNISFDELRNRLNDELGRTTKEEDNNSNALIIWIDNWIKRREKLKDKDIRTIQKYKTIFNRLKTYSDSLDKPLEWEDINRAFVEDYTYWLYNETRVSSANTANKEFQTLTFIFSQAYLDKVHNNDFFRGRQFSVPRVKTSTVALTANEVDQLFSYDYEGNKLYSSVRDWFVIACESALRISDLKRIKRENIQTEGEHTLLKMISRKTSKRIVIPASKRMLELLERNDFKFPKIKYNDFNDLIKDVCKEAKITTKVLVKKNVKGKTKSEFHEKWEMLSSHSGRKTWASINYLKGIPVQLLLNVTQHSSEKTFLAYVDLTEEQKSLRLIKEMNDRAKIIDMNKTA